MKFIIGTIIHSLDFTNLEIIERGGLLINDQGTIVNLVHNISEEDVEKTINEHGLKDEEIVKLSETQFIFPGLIDCHIHAPQFQNLGTGLDLPLMKWLNEYTFPAEQSFSNIQKAKEVYPKLVEQLVKQGTTSACYFGTIHVEGSVELARAVQNKGQRGFIGKVCMDINSPDNYIENTEESLKGTEEFVGALLSDEFKGKDLVTPIITPRFAPTCSMELLKGLAKLANEYDLPIQSHFAESHDEVEFTTSLYPSEHYKDVFDQVGLLGNKSVMAHCCYSGPVEIEALKRTGTGVAHCPTSNFFVGGLLNTREMVDNGVKIGLGTDVSGGFSSSVIQNIRTAMINSQVIFMTTDRKYKPIQLKEAIYIATMGGAQVMGLDKKVGNFLVGKEFDSILVDLKSSRSNIELFPEDTPLRKFEKFIMTGDDRNILKVFVKGNCIHENN
ncbi:guanine deaminase [Conidiobolus coronatus NRRL 28638]|uniref:Guanine deaminase n=1 Tax=Conidiobolus coronatus (strain ATCC 28846 / CBS 209.66 / NRRL 28638) TaxID=796925 RepID=A0A137NZX4_CONC2|nr:guanine deaminase [Conidiobolus coronatus NRRL 28638]|eukprot:KXN68366.1 guanine deaminase [Conidiobolus coronatus NRRL 28638]